jgi:hypothetical protein
LGLHDQLLDEVDRSLAARWVTQLAQRLGLDLTNAFASHTASPAHLLQRSLLTIDQKEAECSTRRPRGLNVSRTFSTSVRSRIGTAASGGVTAALSSVDTTDEPVITFERAGPPCAPLSVEPLMGFVQRASRMAIFHLDPTGSSHERLNMPLSAKR